MLKLPLHDRQGNVRSYALIDDIDWPLAAYRWSQHSAGYAYRMVKRQAIYLHREVMGLSYGDGTECDHINGDRLDCTRNNLRTGTTAQNRQNIKPRPGSARGVYLNKKTGKWYVQVKSQGVKHCLGTYQTKEEAMVAAKAGREKLLPFSHH